MVVVQVQRPGWACPAPAGAVVAGLRACAAVGDLAELDRALPGPDDVVALVGMAANAGFCALASAPVPAAYAAVRAAGRVAGEAGIDEERERRHEVDWLVAQLHLTL